MPLIRKNILYVFLLIFTFSVKAQDFGDPSFYLLDSLNLEVISENDRELIDSSLTIFHQEKNDSIKLFYIQHIVDNCWDNQVWPRYNDYLINYTKKKLPFCTDLNATKSYKYYLAGAISNKGFLFDEKGDLLNALNHYQQALMLYESIENKKGMSTALNNLGVIYSVVGDTSKALKYHKQSLEIKKELEDYMGIAMSYNNIGTIHENAGRPFRALEYFESSLKIREKINDEMGIAMSYDNIGDIYYAEGVYAKAFDYYKKGLALWTELGIPVGISTSHDNMATVLLAMGKMSEAKEHALIAYETAMKLGSPADISNSAKTLSNIYRVENNYEAALHFSDEYIHYKELIKNDENLALTYKKSMQYEYQKEALKDSLEYVKEREVTAIKLDEQKTQNYALFSILFLLVILFIIGIRFYMQKRRDNDKINAQKKEVEEQKKEIEKQHQVLAVTHKEISDSISYAKRIQEAILPPLSSLQKELRDGFVFYAPKDVVSGDFYWMATLNSGTLFAVADCTGHGVPGAMVSVVCHNALNRSVREFGLENPAQILDKTREIVIETFAKSQNNVKDGMDISICKISHSTNEMSWAGANNPLYILKSNQEEITVIQPDKQPIGVFENQKEFTNHTIKLEKGDSIYLFSDGFMDQFGGPHGKKYKYSRFRDLLKSIAHEAMDEQGKLLKKEFESWRGSLEQIDDVCVMGVRIL